jgi:hypothetical protein
LAAVAVAASVGAGLALTWSSNRRPRVFDLVGRNLEARDARGRLLWAYGFNSEVSRTKGSYFEGSDEPSDGVARLDLKADGVMTTLVPVRFGREAMTARSDALYAFSDDGRVLWSVTEDRKLTCGHQTVTGPWFISWVQVSDGPGPRRIWVAYHHHTEWPSFVVEVSPTGAPSLRYVQSGWIMSLANWNTPHGLRLIVGGVMNEPSRPSLAVIDPNDPPVVSPFTSQEFNCGGGDAANPERVILFPNFEVTLAMGYAYEMVTRMSALGADLRVEIGSNRSVSLIAPEGRVKELLHTDEYWFAHQKLHQEGKLGHSADYCPERTTPAEIRSWTPGASWQTYVVGHASQAARRE